MPIETICSGCGQRLRVPDKHAGQTARCPQCRALYTVPKPEPSESAAHPSVVDTSSPAAVPNTSGPHPLVGTPDDLFYLKSGGRSFGPISREELLTWRQDGRVPPDAYIQREGWAAVPAATFFYYLDNASTNASSIDESPQALAQPAMPAELMRRSHRGVLVLVLGLASLGSFCTCAFASPGLALATFIVGGIELHRMKSEASSSAGRILVFSGFALAGVSLIFAAGYVVALFR